jgi:LPXTG-motif cell wall-anchored protein
VKKALVGENYLYEPRASDADNGSFLSFSLLKRPEGMTLQPGGQLVWTPTASQKGTQHVELSVSDGVDMATQSFDIQVSAPAVAGGEQDTTVMMLVGAGIACAVGAVVAGWLLGKKKRGGEN